ncbi:uncharacterized protein [Dermacentor albipictus]|uniref:uncharacterized protein n=1 Tax=Dermacentor albipictus TaxID=60249 RepID=UPI0031FDAF03
MKQFLEVLNVTEQNAVEKGTKLFASQLKTKSLRVTLLSTLDIINYLFNKGALYVLTAKLNQDPLEQYFGLARSFRGDESHPTVMNFSQIFCLLSLYTPIKTALRGSVQGEPNAVLVTLNTARAVYRLNRASLRNEIEARLLAITSGPSSFLDRMDIEYSYFRGDVDDAVTYHLCGYVIHKMSKHTECELCLHDISSTVPLVSSDALLTTYRSFKERSLKHLTMKRLQFIKIANDSVSFFLDQAGLRGDLFWKVLDELDKCTLAQLGCNGHMCAFTCQILNFFIAMRMHFNARDANRHLETREKVAITNKKSSSSAKPRGKFISRMRLL